MESGTRCGIGYDLLPHFTDLRSAATQTRAPFLCSMQQMRLEMKYNIVGYLTDGLVPRSLASEAALEAKAKAAKQATASSSNVDKKD